MAKKLRKSTKQSKHLTAFVIKHVLFNSQSTAETQKEKPHCFSQVDLSSSIVLQDVDF